MFSPRADCSVADFLRALMSHSYCMMCTIYRTWIVECEKVLPRQFYVYLINPKPIHDQFTIFTCLLYIQYNAYSTIQQNRPVYMQVQVAILIFRLKPTIYSTIYIYLLNIYVSCSCKVIPIHNLVYVHYLYAHLPLAVCE